MLLSILFLILDMDKNMSLALAMNSFGIAISCFALFISEFNNDHLFIAGIFGVSLDLFLFLAAFYLLVAPKLKI